MLRAVSEGLWLIDHALAMPGGFEIGTRTSVVRLSDGGLALIAPGPITPEDFDAIRALGPVRALIAPNRFHHLFLADAHGAFTDAALFAVPGVAAKYPALRFETLADEPPTLWKGVLEQVVVEGAPRLGEIAFLHPASRTLLLTDLCFHIRKAANLRTRIFASIAGVWDRFGPSRLARSMMRDKALVRHSVDRILDWDFDRVVVTHGDVVESGGREALREAFAWL